VFECESDGELLSITHIAHEPKRTVPVDGDEDEDEEDDTPDYTGPVFEDLDDTLQQVGNDGAKRPDGWNGLHVRNKSVKDGISHFKFY